MAEKIYLNKLWDCIVIGLGPAGYSAGIYATRYNMFVLLVGDYQGGMIEDVPHIENYPGFTKISGNELTERMKTQYVSLGGSVYENTIADVDKKGKEFVLTTVDNKKLKAKTVILATGTKRRKLNVEGEDKFNGRGVSYCATCDAPFFKNKIVCVVGGGDSAFGAALHLSQFASKVYLVHRRKKFRAQPANIDAVRKQKNVEFILESVVTKIEGQLKVSNIVLQNTNTGKEKKLVVDGVFIEAGLLPTTNMISKLKLKKENDYIVVEKDMSTNIEGIFGAGDCTNAMNEMKQIVTAVAGGAIAAESAYKFVNKAK